MWRGAAAIGEVDRLKILLLPQDGEKAGSIELAPEEQSGAELLVRRTTSARRDVSCRCDSERGFRGQQRTDPSSNEDAAGHGEEVAGPVLARPDERLGGFACVWTDPPIVKPG